MLHTTCRKAIYTVLPYPYIKGKIQALYAAVNGASFYFSLLLFFIPFTTFCKPYQVAAKHTPHLTCFLFHPFSHLTTP